MTEPTLADLGWSAHFQSQIDPADPENEALGDALAARVTSVHRDRVEAIAAAGPIVLTLPPDMPSGQVAVGDWLMWDPETARVLRLLERRSLLRRPSAGADGRDQLIAANVDTLMIVTSCNDDFNPARLERYLALSEASGTLPLILLTKPDLAEDAASYRRTAERLSPLASVVCLNARDPDDLTLLEPWLKPGETVALVGSSGVGKSTLMNGLTGQTAETRGIREDDAKGRHTTTARNLYRARGGAWVIDTPGMRSLPLSDSAEGIDAVFADVADLATQCRFSDCAHETEPGCAIQAAIKADDLDPARLDRWQKLRREDQHNSETIAEARSRSKGFGKKVRAATKARKAR